MNEKEEPKNAKKPDILKRRSFYATLYSCVGVMLVLAVIIGYTNFRKSPAEEGISEANSTPGTNILTQAGDEEFPDGLEVSQSGDDYLNLPGREQDSARADETVPLIIEPGDADIVEGGYGEPIDPELSGLQLGDGTGEDLEALGSQETSGTGSVPPDKTSNQSAFRSFDETSDIMNWPVLGDIVMDYSVDRLIYDKTLEQYRTNNNICIAAPEGTAVKSAAPGVVAEVFTTRENGRTVVVDHGNGWTTTYSQLQDNILVRAGDVVESGQQIGSVGTPSMFSSLLGSHLAFTVHKDAVTVDPNKILYSK